MFYLGHLSPQELKNNQRNSHVCKLIDQLHLLVLHQVLVDYSHLIECLNVYLDQDNYMRGDDALLCISPI